MSPTFDVKVEYGERVQVKHSLQDLVDVEQALLQREGLRAILLIH